VLALKGYDRRVKEFVLESVYEVDHAAI
jgi:hypothetical protein